MAASKWFGELLQRLPYLHAVIVTDKDGVVLLHERSATAEKKTELSNEFAANLSVLLEQASRLRMGSVKTVSTFFTDLIMVQTMCTPLVCTLVGRPDANLGQLHELMGEIRQAVERLLVKATTNVE